MADNEVSAAQEQEQIGREALKAYDLQVQDMQYMDTYTNAYCMVKDAQGARYALRIYAEIETSLNDNSNEIYWLNSLLQRSDLPVTVPVQNREGEWVTCVGDKRCALFHWVPGEPLGQSISPARYEQLGKLVARLHQATEGLEIGHLKDIKRWDRVFYYPKEPIVYRDEAHRASLSEEDIADLDGWIAQADRFLAQLYKKEPMLIHGDIHPGNVHVDGDTLHLIDFEDVMLGFPLQDIAILLYYRRSREDYPELKARFLKGYASVRALPEADDMQYRMLIAARTLMFINYALQIMDDPRDYVQESIQEVRDLLS